MTAAHALWLFAGASGVLTITPGLDTALVLQTTATAGPRAALSAGLGICLGCLAWGLAVALGLAVWLTASPQTYALLRYGAAIYLGVVAVTLWRERGRPPRGATDEARGAAGRRGGAFPRGLFTNLLNPKVGLFYTSFLPLFIPPGVSPGWFAVLLSSIHAAEGVLWFAFLAAATQRVSSWLAQGRVRQCLNRATAVVFLGAAWRLVRDR